MARERMCDGRAEPYAQETSRKLTETDLGHLAGSGQGYDEKEGAYHADCPNRGAHMFNLRPGDHAECLECGHELDVAIA